ncbi:MAG TPA: type II secretion system protein N [Allosphingosinicella sp.]|jgi:general secretion pathway protein N
MSALIRTRILFFIGAFAVSLLATLPLRFVFDGSSLAAAGLAAREAKGSLWSGGLADLQWGPVRLGDFDAGARPLQLLLGRFAVGLEDRGARETHGTVVVARSGAGVSGADALVPVGSLLAPLPIAAFELEQVTIRFGPRGCIEAAGLVRARTAGALAGIALPPSLSGTPRCEGGLLILPLASQAGSEALELRLGSGGRYEAAVILRPGDPAVAASLAAAGFRRTSRGYLTVVRGSLSSAR